MNLSKSYEYFQPESIKGKIHIIGCGSVGSTLAENFVRCGMTNFVLWDFDTVESKNIVNQIFTEEHIGKPKTEALVSILKAINPEINVEVKEGWNGESLSGYVFMCVDNIEIRKDIVQKNMYSINVKAVFDFRTLLESAQHYAADWSIMQQRKNLLNSMDFSHEEASEETPVSACGTTLGLCPVVRIVCALGTANFIKFIKERKLKTFVNVDINSFLLDAF